MTATTRRCSKNGRSDAAFRPAQSRDTRCSRGRKTDRSTSLGLSPEDREAIKHNRSQLLQLANVNAVLNALDAKLAAIVEPGAPGSFAAIRAENEAEPPVSPVAVELIYVEPQPKVTPADPRFPPCRWCGSRRYWITATGKVVCSRPSCGEVCYILASIEFHPIA